MLEDLVLRKGDERAPNIGELGGDAVWPRSHDVVRPGGSLEGQEVALIRPGEAHQMSLFPGTDEVVLDTDRGIEGQTDLNWARLGYP